MEQRFLIDYTASETVDSLVAGCWSNDKNIFTSMGF